MVIEPGLEITADGSSTLYSRRYGQHYHNRFGAKSQSRHVFLEGTGTARHPGPSVLEIGFGVGMNFMTTLASVLERGAAAIDERATILNYRALEFDPVPREVLSAYGVTDYAGTLSEWHGLVAQWGSPSIRVSSPILELEVDFCDATTATLPIDWASAIYLDGFSPEANPELWTRVFLERLAQALKPGGRLATYSAAGHVRRSLEHAGLQTKRMPGIAGKREFLVATRPVA